MPFKGLTPAVFNRIKDRVQRELGGVPTDDATNPVTGDQRQMSPALWKRILERAKDVVQDKLDPQSRSKSPKKPSNERLDVPTVKARFAEAGRLGVMVLMNYNNVWRLVEPYSFRVKNKNGKTSEWLFGFCRLHETIEMYRPEKVQGINITDQKYSSRWTVEF